MILVQHYHCPSLMLLKKGIFECCFQLLVVYFRKDRIQGFSVAIGIWGGIWGKIALRFFIWQGRRLCTRWQQGTTKPFVIYSRTLFETKDRRRSRLCIRVNFEITQVHRIEIVIIGGNSFRIAIGFINTGTHILCCKAGDKVEPRIVNVDHHPKNEEK